MGWCKINIRIMNALTQFRMRGERAMARRDALWVEKRVRGSTERQGWVREKRKERGGEERERMDKK